MNPTDHGQNAPENRPNLSTDTLAAILGLEGRLNRHHARINQLAALITTVADMHQERTISPDSEDYEESCRAGWLLYLLTDMAAEIAAEAEQLAAHQNTLALAKSRGEFQTAGGLAGVDAP